MLDEFFQPQYFVVLNTHDHIMLFNRHIGISCLYECVSYERDLDAKNHVLERIYSDYGLKPAIIAVRRFKTFRQCYVTKLGHVTQQIGSIPISSNIVCTLPPLNCSRHKQMTLPVSPLCATWFNSLFQCCQNQCTV